MRAEIVTDDLKAQIYKTNGIPAASQANKERLIVRSIIAVERQAKINARSGAAFSSRSKGMLARKIGWKIEGDGAAVITSGVVYGRIQEFGGVTKPHDIPLRFAKAFAFASGGGGFSNAAKIGSSKVFARIGSNRISKGIASGKTITGMTVVSGSKGTPGIIKHPGSRIPATHYTRNAFETVRPKIEDDASRMIQAQAGGPKWP